MFASTSVQEQHSFKHFKPLNGSFSVISVYLFEETCISLESAFHAKLNGPLYTIVSVCYDCIIKKNQRRNVSKANVLLLLISTPIVIIILMCFLSFSMIYVDNTL